MSTFLDCCFHFKTLKGAVDANDLRLLKRIITASRLPQMNTRRYPPFLYFHVVEAATAAELGTLKALKLLFEVNPRVVGDEDIFTVASQHGHMDIIQWLYENCSGDRVYNEGEVARAVECGHYKAVKFLTQQVHLQVVPKRMDAVVKRGDLEMINWLDKHPELYSRAFDSAADNGRLDVIQGLHAKKQLMERASRAAKQLGMAISRSSMAPLALRRQFYEEDMDKAAVKGATKAMEDAVKNGHLTWSSFFTSRRKGYTTDTMDGGAVKGFVEVAQWLHTNRSEGCTTTAMDEAAGGGHLDIVQFLHANRSEGCTTNTMDKAAGFGHLEVMKWLHENRTEDCTTDAMDTAAGCGQLAMVKWLHKNRLRVHGKCMESSGSGHLKVLDFLLVHRPEGIRVMPSTQSCDMEEIRNNAEDYKRKDILEWLEDVGELKPRGE